MSRGNWWLLGIGIAGALWHLATREPGAVTQGPGVLAPNAPKQVAVDHPQPISMGRFKLTPMADFEAEARVLSRHSYTFDDEAELSPLDFALGWGRMSDSAVLAQLDIDQSVRFFTYRWSTEPPIPSSEIVVSATNVHLIPEDISIKRALDRVHPGQVVRLRGWLVSAEREDGWHWASSLTREDTGAGACELLLVTQVAIVNAGG